MLRIKVPATSANLCVGFDVLGLALSLYNEFTFIEGDSFSFEGFETRFSNYENLVYKAYLYTFNKAKKKIIPVKIIFRGEIPIARGLGSSSSLIVAGVFAANYFLNNMYSKEQLFNFCVDIEGHPDNVGAAIYGGLVASYKKEDSSYQPICYKVSDKLKYLLVIPKYPVETSRARQVLPDELSYQAVVNNLSRIINIPKAFEAGDLELIKDLFKDEIHEPYRKNLIADYSLVKAEFKDYASCISGSGSTILIISTKKITKKLLGFSCENVSCSKGIIIEELD